MLRGRPANWRRAILLISEGATKAADQSARVLTAADFANVAIYSVDMSKVMAR